MGGIIYSEFTNAKVWVHKESTHYLIVKYLLHILCRRTNVCKDPDTGIEEGHSKATEQIDISQSANWGRKPEGVRVRYKNRICKVL